MKLEQQVVSLELAKEMKELGFDKYSLFGWYESYGDIGGKYYVEYISYMQKIMDEYGHNDRLVYQAYTVAELGEMLYQFSEENIIKAYGYVFKVKNTMFIITPRGLATCLMTPDIIAKMLIYLKKNNLLGE